MSSWTGSWTSRKHISQHASNRLSRACNGSSRLQCRSRFRLVGSAPPSRCWPPILVTCLRRTPRAPRLQRTCSGAGRPAHPALVRTSVQPSAPPGRGCVMQWHLTVCKRAGRVIITCVAVRALRVGRGIVICDIAINVSGEWFLLLRMNVRSPIVCT